MLDINKQQKIKMFMADKTMNEAVKEVIRETFLQDHGTKDVQTLAAERIAISLLDIGFKELKKYADKADQEIKELKQVGL